MQIPVVVEKVKDMVYQARSGEPLAASAEGPTPDEALRKLREVLTERIRAGANLVQLDVPAADNPWMPMAGIFADDPTFDEWQEAIAENRRRDDADPDAL